MKYREINSEFYCGVDVHSKRSYICVLDNTGKKYLNRSMVNNFQDFKEVLHLFLPNVVVGCESTYSYYWLADGCHEHRIPFYLGHALYMKAISANKQKNDKLDARTIAELLRTNFFPEAYPYPREMRPTRDLLRRRHRLVRIRAEAYSHIQYETHNIKRFPRHQNYASYCRVVRPQQMSNGKVTGRKNMNMGNPYLKWAFNSIIISAQQSSERINRYYQKLKSRYGRSNARVRIAHKFNTAIYYMLKNSQPFDEKRFVQ